MSDELVKELQESARFADSRGYGGLCEKLIKAADAIEELSKRLEDLECINIGDLDCDENQLCTCMGIVRNRLEAIEAQKPSWIPVNERLPEKGQAVLVYGYSAMCEESSYKDKGYGIGAYSNLFDHWNVAGQYDPEWESFYVTHWMPLPTPPEAESEAGET